MVYKELTPGLKERDAWTSVFSEDSNLFDHKEHEVHKEYFRTQLQNNSYRIENNLMRFGT
ncbi:hypothetical protein D3C86_1729000 [compost metagenome]